MVSGASAQPSINGIYLLAHEHDDGRPYYTKGEGDETRVLHWSKQDRRWAIADKITGDPRAKEASDGPSPEFKPPPHSGWRVYNALGYKWDTDPINGDCIARLIV